MARLSKEAILKKQHSKNVAKHIQQHYKRYEFKLHNERQKDIIEYLEQKENKQQYITNLILQDMIKEQGNE